jgi:hypothetical protein
VTGDVTFAPTDMVQTITVLEGNLEIKTDGADVATDGILLNNNGRSVDIASAGDAMFASYSAYGMNVAANGLTSILINGSGSNFVKVFNTNNVNSYTDHSDAGIKIYVDAAELVELGSWGLGISDTNGGAGGNTTEVLPTGVYATTAENVSGDSYSSHLTSSELSLGFSTNYDPLLYFKINQSGLHFPDGSTQVSAFLPPHNDGNYYVYRNGAWLAATIYTHGGKNYLTV